MVRRVWALPGRHGPLRGEARAHVLTRPCRWHSVYSGHQSVLVPPPELESNVSLWLWAVSQYKARVTFCSYSVMEMCARGLGAQTAVLRVSVALALGTPGPRRAVGGTGTLSRRPGPPWCELPSAAPSLWHSLVHLAGEEGWAQVGWV